jgi:hypothetical protein
MNGISGFGFVVRIKENFETALTVNQNDGTIIYSPCCARRSRDVSRRSGNDYFVKFMELI